MLTRREWIILIEKFNTLLAYYRTENERLMEEVRVLKENLIVSYDASTTTSTAKEN